MLRKAAAVLACLSLASCSWFTETFAPPPPTMPTKIETRPAAIVMPLSSCKAYRGTIPETITPPKTSPAQEKLQMFIPVVAAAAVSMLVNAAADAVQSSIAKAQSDLTASYVAYGAGPATNTSTCLVIARGMLGPWSSSYPYDHKGLLYATDMRALGFADYPSLYVEIAVGLDSTEQYLLFEPVLAQFDDTAAPNPGWSGKKDIGILLSFATNPVNTGNPPTASDFKQTAVALPFDLGQMKRGTYIETPNDSVFGVLRGGIAQGKQDPFADQLRIVPASTLSPPGHMASYNAYAMVTESGQPGFFDKIVVDALSKQNLSGLAAAITNAINGKKQ